MAICSIFFIVFKLRKKFQSLSGGEVGIRLSGKRNILLPRKPLTRLIARAERVVALSLSVRSDCVVKRTNAPRTRSRTRVCKNQKISLHFSRVSSPHPSAAKRKKKWKGNFWFCYAVSVSEKSIIILSHFDCSFLRLHGDPRRPASAFSGSSNLREPHTSAFAQPARFARAGCFGVVCVRSVTLYLFCISSRTNPFLIVLENYVVF